MPLVGWEPVIETASRVLGRDAAKQLCFHTFVALRPANGSSEVHFFDFLPLHPTSPVTQARLLTGGSVPAELRARQLRALDSGWAVQLEGSVADNAAALAAIQAFNDRWRRDMTLKLMRRDCRSYSGGLLAALRAEGLLDGPSSRSTYHCQNK